MATRRRRLVDIDTAGFALDDALREWLDREWPTIDPVKTVELFRDKALAKGWVYADWNAAFRNYIRKSLEWGGVAHKPGLHDPAFSHLIEHARSIGFRMPQPHESAGVYRTALNEYDKNSAVKQSSLFGNVLRRIPK